MPLSLSDTIYLLLPRKLGEKGEDSQSTTDLCVTEEVLMTALPRGPGWGAWSRVQVALSAPIRKEAKGNEARWHNGKRQDYGVRGTWVQASGPTLCFCDNGHIN